jgi:hypothetical protein
MALVDPAYVDAYFGPEEWRPNDEEKPTLEELREDVVALRTLLSRAYGPSLPAIQRLRQHRLEKVLIAADTRLRILAGEEFTFDEESRLIYDIVAPKLSDEDLEKMRREVALALPGEGNLSERYIAYTEQFNIPPDKTDEVFTAAIEESRRRAKEALGDVLPDNESFTKEYVTGKSWSAYNWYQGGAQSIIQVNVDSPIAMSRIIHLASHEGYPGHHLQNILFEGVLYRQHGWPEFSVYPLFSPSGALLEGAANYGVEVAYPAGEKVAFERDVLFPLAGLDPEQAEEYSRISTAASSLSRKAGTEIGRRYLDGEIDQVEAIKMLRRYGLMTRDLAARKIRFYEAYGAYIINYDVGDELSRDYIETRAADSPEARWQELVKLFSEPHVPSDMLRDKSPFKFSEEE